MRDQEPVGAACPVAVSPLPAVRRLARKRRSSGDEDPPPLSLSYKVHVASVNNFPTAAGLASSAAGYACLGGCPQGAPRRQPALHPPAAYREPRRTVSLGLRVEALLGRVPPSPTSHWLKPKMGWHLR